MHSVIQTLQNALGYAKFADEDVRDATLKLVDELGTDLQPEYEPGSTVEAAVNELETALNNTDSATEDTTAAIKNADPATGVEEEGPTA